MASPDSSRRAARLRHVFFETLEGKRFVRSTHDGQLFLEALRTQPSPSRCVELLVSKPSGLDAVREAVRSDLSAAFISAHTLPFLRFLSDPGVKTLVDGQHLEQVLLAVASPPTLLNALIVLFESGKLPDGDLYSFAWLALELISLRPGAQVDVSNLLRCVSEDQRFITSQDHTTREIGYKVKKVIQLRSSPGHKEEPGGPGGRHDNDFADISKIHIYPTTDEFLSTQQPYYQTAREILDTEVDKRPRAHLDNHFRLLREDMIAELREDIQVATGKKKGKRNALLLGNFVPAGIDIGDETGKRYKRCTLLLRCFSGLGFISNMPNDGARKKYLKDHASLLRHQAFGVLCREQEILGFAFVDRDIDRLAQSTPIVSLQFTDDDALRRALLALSIPKRELVQFILVDTPVFAYEPVLLGLQRITDLPLLDLLVNPAAIPDSGFETPKRLCPLVSKLQTAAKTLSPDGVVALASKSTGSVQVEVDDSQLNALLLALTSPVSLIQGPPGTGKSFIGAQIARCLFEAGLRILVLSYTNHALDQFLEDLLKAGIPHEGIVRIGSKAKCTPQTANLLLSEQKGQFRRSPQAWDIINLHKREAESLGEKLKAAFQRVVTFSPKWNDIEEYLEFEDGGEVFLDALRVPTQSNGWVQAGKGGKEIRADSLYYQWIKGQGPGKVSRHLSPAAMAVWNMPPAVRAEHHHKWLRSMIEEHLQIIEDLTRDFNAVQRKINLQFSEADANAVLQKKIIGCTTTGAAKYDRLIRAANPDVILIEESGEILESHVLTALASTVKQLVLIGDHKQLRPKINNYALSVERGDGFDLNRSLFERLILQGARHATLHKQHRMVPEISVFARELTYPNLLDGPRTSGRPKILGLQDRVIFLNHTKQEDTDKQVRDRRDPGMKESKKNTFEAEMVLRCVKYLGQQGYASDKIVILTPYLGQLRVLRDLLAKNQHDPALSEMDKNELIRAGLISAAAANHDKKPLRISTIDNYQGEESDIVIASLTRSNASGDIGFMFAPERLNVLITRARNGIVLIGNMDTFMNSKKGKATWHPFFDLLKSKGHLYDGLPVYCGKHPQRTALLKDPIDFDKSCPDGGCTELCDAPLKCGVHKCTSRCHRVVDHSRTQCNQLVSKVCGRQHKIKVRCEKQKDDCHKCIQEDKEMERRVKRDLQLEQERAQREAEYTKKLQDIQDEVEHQRRINKYEAEEELRKQTLEQQLADLEALKDTEQRLRQQNKLKAEAAEQAAKAKATASARSKDEKSTAASKETDSSSGAQAEWEFAKKYEGAQSKPLDALMEMIGLEEVKQEFLSVKSKVDTALRQRISMAGERFSCSMLGNPGTGKTTVARMYAQFLTELCVIPGSCFKENTGAGLANLGVSGCKTLLDDILNQGGGVLFIDEAYQLTSGNSQGGGAVLDYLLAEVENLRGKVVFVLAGYNKQMESFFAHNPGLPSRFPVEMKFADYTDEELLKILGFKINDKYKDSMNCEDGLTGLYCRIVSRRIGYSRGKEGFGNARAVENNLDRISRRQANRLRRERQSGAKPSDFFFTKEDLIGPDPGEALTKCEAWKKLQGLIGLGSVKQAVMSLVHSIQQNYIRELEEQPPIQYSLNKVFLGNPGTGKTTVAKLYGAILVSLGFLSKGEVIVKNPSDFVGAHLGQSEQQTKGILAAAVGKVLVIDEAYGLYGGGSQGGTSDPYKTAVIDTIVADVQSVPGDDRCVLLLGYKDQMEEMFQNVNPGLSRRFPIASGFNFEDFDDEEMRSIFNLKIKQQGYQATHEAANVAMEMLNRARNRPNFGNAGEIDILLDATKARHQSRVSKGQAKSPTLLEALDFDENFNRASKAETNIQELFEGTVGSEQIVSLLQSYQDTVRTMKSLEMDPKENIPFNFLFRGPPGTGKTTTAKKMGHVFYDMGFLAAAKVVECSATDLIGQYVGQTGPKVHQLFDKALGKVLFVDEAYRLAEGHFAKEAMDEIVDSVTKDRYYKKLIIILAGYEDDINRLMSVNTGLTSRFPEVIDFRALTAEECVALMLQLLRKQKNTLMEKSKKQFDISCLEMPTAPYRQALLQAFRDLAAQDNWASARDVQALSKKIFNKTLRDEEGLAQGILVLTETVITTELDEMLKERASRASSVKQPPSFNLNDLLRPPSQTAPTPPQPSTATTTSQTTAPPPPSSTEPPEDTNPPPTNLATRPKPTDTTNKPPPPSPVVKRDAGVSDIVWAQLQHDRQLQEQREAEYQQLKQAAKNASDAARDAIVKRLLEEEAARKKEEEMRKKLKEMGLCPMGYEWIQQVGGWRCAGGSHFVMAGEGGLGV